MRLIRTKGGVDAALDYAKTWSRYAKELLAWTEKRASLGEGPSALPHAPGPRQCLHRAQLRPLLSSPRARVCQKHHENRRGWQGVNPPAGSHEQTPPPPRAQALQNRSPDPLDPQHLLTPAFPPQSHMPLQYIYTLFLEHDLSLGALAMETVAQQKRDYYQVRGPCCMHYSFQSPLPRRKALPSVPFCS